MLQYEIYSHLVSNETSQQNSKHSKQDSTRKCAACCTIKVIEKLMFLCDLILLNRQKVKSRSSLSIQVIRRGMAL